MLTNRRICVWAGTILLCVMALNNSQISAADLPVLRDVWYAMEADEQRYGFEHVTVTKRDDGNYVYRSESKLLVDLLGQKQEILRNGTFVVSPALSPIEFTIEGTQQSGTTKITGRIDQEDFVLVYEHNDLRRERRVKLADNPLLLPCLDDWLHHHAGQTEAIRRPIIDDASLELKYADCLQQRADGSGIQWNVNLRLEDLNQGTITLDPAGIRNEATFRVPKRYQRRVEPAEAIKIKHLVIPANEMLLYPVGRRLGPLQLVTSLTVRLNWKGPGFESLRLEDDRQKITETSSADGQTNVLIRIQPVPALDSELTWPIAGDEFQKYLSEERFIKPRDAEVAKQARAWIGDEKTAAGAVRALSTGVFKFMEGGTLIAETLNAPEILRCKQGKCSEFAILFASVARSVGIPTRIVLGMRMMQGSWVGHMWNEAYIGRWITVDSTVDEVGTTFALLKLVDSDTVFGTQTARWAAANALQVTIEDSSPATPSSDKKYPTGIEGPVYTNAEFACRLTAPATSWSIENVPSKVPGMSPTLLRFKVPNHDNVLIHFVPFEVPPAFTVRSLIAIRVANFKAQYKNFEILKDEDYTVHTLHGRRLAFRHSGGKTEADVIKTTEFLWTDGQAMFLLNIIADEKSHDEHAAEFMKLLNSFESLRENSSSKQ